MYTRSLYIPSQTLYYTMIWPLILLAAAMCAPIARDPNFPGQLIESDQSEYQTVMSGFISSIQRAGSKEHLVNKQSDKYMSFISHSLKDSTNVYDMDQINFDGEDIFHSIDTEDESDSETSIEDIEIDQSDSESESNDDEGQSHDTDINVEDIALGNKLDNVAFFNAIYRAVTDGTFAHEKSSASSGYSVGEQKVDLFNNLPHMYPQSPNSRQRGYKSQVRRQISEVLLDIDREIYKQFSQDQMNLQQVYEKMGGVCTLIQGYRRSPLYVISKCPDLYYNARIKHLCEYVSPISKTLHHENVIEITNSPVQDKNGLVYRNMYCAQCRGAIDGIQAWTTSLVCDEMQRLQISDGQQDVTFLEEFDDKYQGCQRVVTPACTRGIHECLNSEIKNVMRHGHQIRMGDNSKTDFSPFPLSFTLFMNFGFDGKTHILFSTAPTDQLGYNPCDDNEMYDPVNDKCRVVYCNGGYQLVDGSCQKTTSYEFDPDSQDFDFSHTNEPLKIVLTLRNISSGMLYLLSIPGMEGLVTDELAAQVNISRDRIHNMNVTYWNTSASDNSTLKNEMKVFQIEDANENINFKADTEVVNTDDTSVKQSDKSYIDLINSTVYNSNTSKELITYFHELNIINKTGNKHGPQEYTLKPTQPMKSEWSYDSDMRYSVRIEFILEEAHKNTTVTEKSVKSVLATMTDLIRNNSFMFTLNGTNFQIQSLKNPEPASLDHFCTNGDKKFYDQDQFVFTSSIEGTLNGSRTIVYINETDKVYSTGQFDLTFSFDGIMSNLSRTQMDSFVIVCDTPKIKNEFCPRILLGSTEYVMFGNFSVLFANQTYNMSEYEFNSSNDKSIWICLPDWSNAQRLYNTMQWSLVCGDNMIKVVIAESYLTFILGIVSIVSMLTVLLTYGLFERLRNLPGINTVNLTLSLFLGELVFILSGWIQPHLWLCSAVGVLLHYLFLASFFWMNVMSYDVYRTFATKCILRRIRDKKKFVPRYALYAWGTPFLIVAVCAILDFSKPIKGIDIGYGGSSQVASDENEAHGEGSNSSKTEREDVGYKIGCWIQEPFATMIAFGGPMMLILFSNFVMFTRTIACIRASTKQTRSSVRRASLNHMAGRDDVMLYVRMSTFMGFTWIIGLASSLVSAFAGTPSKTTCITLHLLGILFIILNCSQGLFIFVAFVCNRRVFALYRNLLIKIKQKRKRPLSVSTSQGTIYSVTTSNSINTSTVSF